MLLPVNVRISPVEGLLPVAASESVMEVELSMAAMTVPLGIPAPPTPSPTASIDAFGNPVTALLPLVATPSCSGESARNARVAPAAGLVAVAARESVMEEIELLMAVMTDPVAMPAPITLSPRASIDVLDSPLTTGLPKVVLPTSWDALPVAAPKVFDSGVVFPAGASPP